MENIVSLLLIFLFLALGLLSGRSRFLLGRPAAGRLLDLCLYALLFSMGLRIGEGEGVREQILRVGLIAVVSGLASVLGTALVVAAAARAVARKQARRAPRAVADDQRVAVRLKDPLRLFAAVLTGFATGYLVPVIPAAVVALAATLLLYLLLFLVGFQLSRSGVDLRAALLRPTTLLVPAGAVVGSLAAAAAVAPLLSLPLGRSLSLASGFGWYSLSGVIITNLGDPVLGSAAFLANMLREGVALLVIPLLGRAGLPEVAVAIAGATSMDVTLPVIGRSCGQTYVPVAVASGAMLSFLVPILVPLVYRL